ncbi:MAG TPA: FecR domain-containing protein, partial [Robiginitalea sp.]|nr:FecR domain-containing protein [Robiginitalea sp.]
SSAGRRAWFRPLLRIASVLLIGLLISYFFVYNPGTQIETAAGEKREVTLPDASLVLLNAHSELRFKTSRWESERSVTLEGEAYFRVAKGSRFDVVTPQGTVSVLGTEFNVRQRGDDLEVRCYEGLVRVETPGRQLELAAGHFFQLLQGQVSSGTHQESGPSWAQEISRFDRVPLAEVAAELERLFGVEIQLEGVDGNRLFTGSFLHEDLDQALQAVTRPLSLEYHKSSDQRIIIRPVAP